MDNDKRTADSPPRRLVDYYRFLGVPQDATTAGIVEAYLGKAQDPDLRVQERAEQALTALSDPATRAAYDQDLAVSQAAHSGAARREAGAPGPRQAGAEKRAGSVQVRPTGAPVARNATTGRMPLPPAPPATVINLNWRWALAVIPVLLIIGALMVGNSNGGSNAGAGRSAAAVSAGTLAQAVPAVVGADGVQTLNVLLNGDTFQYEPKVIKVKQGVPVRFNLSVKGDPG